MHLEMRGKSLGLDFSAFDTVRLRMRQVIVLHWCCMRRNARSCA